MGYAKHRKIFTDEMEKDLAEHCINLVKQQHGLPMDKVKVLAYEFAEQSQVPIPKNWFDKRRAGREWMRSFMKRHNLSLRSPEPKHLDEQHHLTALLLASFLKTSLRPWKDITFCLKIFTTWVRLGVLQRKLYLK